MAGSVKEQKHLLRKQIKAKLSQLSEDSIKQQSISVTRKVTALPEYVNARSLSIFLSMPGREISTTDIVLDALSKQKQVFIPYIHSDEESRTKSMHMLRLKDKEDLLSLKPDAWGIPSLSSKTIDDRDNALGGKGISSTNSSTQQKLDLIFMPGMAFDHSRNRLGHGKGFYDKYMTLTQKTVSNSTSDHMPKLGLALAEQLLQNSEEVPTDAFDWKADQVVVADS